MVYIRCNYELTRINGNGACMFAVTKMTAITGTMYGVLQTALTRVIAHKRRKNRNGPHVEPISLRGKPGYCSSNPRVSQRRTPVPAGTLPFQSLTVLYDLMVPSILKKSPASAFPAVDVRSNCTYRFPSLPW